MNHPALPKPEIRLGKYHVVRPLKVGGTAAIYLAVLRGENNFSREVVIKRPLPHLVSDNRARLMFIDEAHIASRLSHPNICQVLDLVARDDELYLVLEYLKGVDLREILKRCLELGRLIPPEVGVWIGIEVCAGLDFAHEAVAIDGSPLGLIHRDVSPKNIRITDSGSVKVIDFGIARAMNRATETAVGTIKGTLGYMSPEQILGDEIDRRSDIFAFGIVLFQMLTCRNPFDGPTLKDRVRRLTQAPVPSVREFNGALDEEIEGIVAKCLHRDAEERYQRMRDVQRDLERYLSKLQGITPRQRLIQFMEDIFPGIHESDPELKSALTEISSITGRIDVAQKLSFPDDEGARPASVATGSTVRPNNTVSTIKDAQFANTKTAAAETASATAASRTAVLEPVTEEQQEPASYDRASSMETTLAARPMPWATVAVLLVLTAAVVAGIVVYLSDRWTSQPIAESSPPGVLAVEPALPDAPPTTTVAVARATPPVQVEKPQVEKPQVEKPQVEEPRVEKPRGDEPRGERAPEEGRTKTARSAPEPGREDSDANRARLYFKTALRLDRAGRTEDALLMYTLAFKDSGRRVDPSILRNLGLLHNKAGDAAKARACFRGYLDRSGTAPDAERIRTLLSSFPPTKSVSCVEGAELARAKRVASRNGAMIDAWVNETIEERLR